MKSQMKKMERNKTPEEMQVELTMYAELGIISQDTVAEAMNKISKKKQEEVLQTHKIQYIRAIEAGG